MQYGPPDAANCCSSVCHCTASSVPHGNHLVLMPLQPDSTRQMIAMQGAQGRTGRTTQAAQGSTGSITQGAQGRTGSTFVPPRSTCGNMLWPKPSDGIILESRLGYGSRICRTIPLTNKTSSSSECAIHVQHEQQVVGPRAHNAPIPQKLSP